MNLVGKIFIGVITLMSIMFMTMACMVYATHKNWKLVVDNTEASTLHPLGLRQQLEQGKKRQQDLQDEFDKFKAQVSEEKLTARQVLAKLEATRDEIAEKRDELQKERDALYEKDQTAVALLDKDHATLKKLTDEVAGLRDEIRKAQEDRDKQFAQVVDLTDKIHQAEQETKRVVEREKQVAAQYAKLKDLARRYNLETLGEKAGPAPLHGKILAVNAESLVEVSIGSDDGLRVGNTLEVYRGSNYLGRVEVMKTDVNRAVGKILPDYKRGIIQKGDDVATRLKLG